MTRVKWAPLTGTMSASFFLSMWICAKMDKRPGCMSVPTLSGGRGMFLLAGPKFTSLLPLMISQVPAPLMCFIFLQLLLSLFLSYLPLSLYLFSSFHQVNYFSFPQRRVTFSCTDRGSTGRGRGNRSSLVKVHNGSSCYGLVPVRS